jgi:sulfur relay (sulfurtransferase) complex TusBCD TusD component (DsrE family)
MDISKFLFVINNAPYGDERPYNALRHAMNLVKRDGVEMGSMDLLGDWTIDADQTLIY